MSIGTVKELLTRKQGAIWTIGPKASTYEALQLMAAKDIGAVMVVENGKLVGIFSERDYARKVILKGKSSKTAPVGEVMTTKVLYVGPEKTVEECMAIMTDKRVRHLPVMENGELIGIVTIGDIVKKVIADQQFRIQELEKYIAGAV